MVIELAPQFCACGRELITAEQLRTGQCELCETLQTLDPNGIDETDADLERRRRALRAGV